MIAGIDGILAKVRAQVESMGGASSGSVHFHVYGKDGVMGAAEPLAFNAEGRPAPHELGIVIEAVAPRQEEAETLASVTRSTLLHFGYEGRISTAGNLAFPFSPSDVTMGAVYEFSLYHLMAIDNPVEFPGEARIVTVDRGRIHP